MNVRRLVMPSLALCLAAMGPSGAPLAGQGVVVDRGQFTVTVGGVQVGSEEFSIRRAGFGRDDAIFANGLVRLDLESGAQDIRPLLRAAPPDGAASSYQVKVTGPESMDLRLTRVGRRYAAIIFSEVGEEDREFPARPGTRVLERDVAHQYYFVRDLREGETAHTLEPRTRSDVVLQAGPWTDETLRLGMNVVPSRRVEFSADDHTRIVWYDRLGRVLRVEIPERAYVAERTDLVG